MKQVLIIAILILSFGCNRPNSNIETDLKKKNDSLTTELTKTKKSLKALKEKLTQEKTKKYRNEDFNRFFYSFMTDSVFQKSRIKFPFIYHTTDIDTEEDIKIVIEEDEWKYNSFYINTASERTQIFDNFELKFQPTNERLLHWYGIEAGGNSKYYFEGINGKWFLAKKWDSGI